jgi:hypothetical protein
MALPTITNDSLSIMDLNNLLVAEQAEEVKHSGKHKLTAHVEEGIIGDLNPSRQSMEDYVADIFSSHDWRYVLGILFLIFGDIHYAHPKGK